MHTHTIVDQNGRVVAFYSGAAEQAQTQEVFGRKAITSVAPSTDHTWDGTQWQPPAASVALASAKAAKLDELKSARMAADRVVKATGVSVRNTAHLNGHDAVHQHLNSLVASAKTIDDLAQIRWTPAEHFHAALDKASFAR